MSKQSLEVLFGSRTRVKILRFFFRNLGKTYSTNDIINHTQENPTEVRKELSKMEEIGLISTNVNYEKKEKTTIKEEE